MNDYLIMLAIALFLGVSVVYKANYLPQGNDHFFDISNSKAMRGFWCIVIILVHVPEGYQNRIQDMMGSFAYIGVTFFFMTSAYGLTRAVMKNPDSIQVFWRKRLPKLLIPCLVTNVLYVAISGSIYKYHLSAFDVISITGWVRWLLTCYLVFWGTHRFLRDVHKANMVSIVLITAGSISIYLLKNAGLVQETTWCTEVYGFIWGMLLAVFYPKMKRIAQEKWIGKAAVSCVIAMVLGVAYLKFKPVLFTGDYLLKIALGIAIIFFILMLNAKIEIGNRVILYLGEISFEVYLLHGNVFYWVINTNSQLSSGIFILISIVMTIVLASVVHLFCRKLFSFIPAPRQAG